MSSIMKALQKLEQDKASRPNRGVDVAKVIVAVGRRPAPPPVWLIPSGIAGVAVLAVLATYAIMGGFTSHDYTPKSQAISPTTASAPAIQAQLAAAPVPLPTTSIREEVIPATRRPPTVKRVTAERPVRRAGSTAPSVNGALTPTVTAQPATRSEPIDTAQKAALEQPADGSRLPAVNVSGIAWQKDNSARLAVVNGILVTEGSRVNGVRVEEISPDRVRFSYRNEKFEVSLGKEPR